MQELMEGIQVLANQLLSGESAQAMLFMLGFMALLSLRSSLRPPPIDSSL